MRSPRVAGSWALAAAALALLALAATVAWSGDAADAAPAASVLADVQPRALGLGRSVAVSGRVSSGRPGEVVHVEQNPCGRGWTYVPAVRAETGVSGTFLVQLDVNAAPVANSRVRVRWGQLQSTAVALRVRPLMMIRPFWGKVRIEIVGQLAADLAARNRHVVLEGRKPGGLWRRISDVPLRVRDTPYGQIPVGLADRPRGYAFVRAFLPAAQAAPCYDGGRSPALGL